MLAVILFVDWRYRAAWGCDKDDETVRPLFGRLVVAAGFKSLQSCIREYCFSGFLARVRKAAVKASRLPDFYINRLRYLKQSPDLFYSISIDLGILSKAQACSISID